MAPLRPLADRARRPVDRRRPALGHQHPRGDRPGLRPLLQRRLLEQEGRGPHVLAGADLGRGRPAGGLQPGHARVRLLLGAARDHARSRRPRATRPSRSRSTAASSSRSRARSPPASRPRASTWSSSADRTTRPRSRGTRSTARARRSSPRPTAPRARTAGTTARSPSASRAATRSSGVAELPGAGDPVERRPQPVGLGHRDRPRRATRARSRSTGSTSTSRRRRSPPPRSARRTSSAGTTPPGSRSASTAATSSRASHRAATRRSTGAPSSATDEATITTEGRDQTVTGTATDLAGAQRDRGLAAGLDRPDGPERRDHRQRFFLFGTQQAARHRLDALSGVRSVEVTYRRGTAAAHGASGRRTRSPARPRATAPGRAPLPGTGHLAGERPVDGLRGQHLAADRAEDPAHVS